MVPHTRGNLSKSMVNEWTNKQTNHSFAVNHQGFFSSWSILIIWQSIKIQTDLVSRQHEWIYNVSGMIQMIPGPFYFWMLLFFFKWVKHFHHNISFLWCQGWNLWPWLFCFKLKITSTSKTAGIEKTGVNCGMETTTIVLSPFPLSVRTRASHAHKSCSSRKIWIKLYIYFFNVPFKQFWLFLFVIQMNVAHNVQERT